METSLKQIFDKVVDLERLSFSDALLLYEKAELSFLGTMANMVRERKNGMNVYFNRNIHVEPTNICIYQCKFCAYSRKAGEPGSWDHSIETIMSSIRNYPPGRVTEVHIVGGVHPDRDLSYYKNMLQAIKAERPELHIKAFTAIEIDYMVKKAGLQLYEGLKQLKESGLDSIPGGGAEIFDDHVRREICGDKSKADMWLSVHETAHSIGIPSNATMLYGHIETYKHRVAHLEKLRDLQDRTSGFNAFIPLKYKHKNNVLSYIPEISSVEDLRNYAICRIFLDNFNHVKAYWPMIGKEMAMLSLSYGVDDLDGTIDDTTRIYSMAGAEESSPSMTSEDMVSIIRNCGYLPVERDSLYSPIRVY